MLPRTTSAAPTQNSTQTGPMGRAIPPMMKPMMIIVTASQDDRPAPWYSSCLPARSLVPRRDRATPVSPTTGLTRLFGHRRLLSLVNAPIILRKVRDYNEPAPGREIVLRAGSVWCRISPTMTCWGAEREPVHGHRPI